MGVLSSLIQLVAPKKASSGGTASDPTFNAASAANFLPIPQYRDHLTDVWTTRQADDSRDLMKFLADNDTDVSATIHGYLTMANVEPVVLWRGYDDQIDPTGTKAMRQILTLLTRRVDYSLGYQHKLSLKALCERFRYMALLRGAISVEAVVDKKAAPAELRVVDSATIKWTEQAAGQLKPTQRAPGQAADVSLDLPGFFWCGYRQNPTAVYPKSPFIAAITTIAARQQVINDLYRIMQVQGYPRITIKVLEETLRKNAPDPVRIDPRKLAAWMSDRLQEIAANFSGLRADQAFIHFDSVEPDVMNEQSAGISLDIGPIIETLNAQNQAGLKTMPTILGRGNMGVNTASVEARLAAMSADELNEPVKDVLEGTLTFFMNLQAQEGYAEVHFPPCELRPQTELEPQLLAKATRLRQDLSDGLITDEQYHLSMYGHLPADGIKPLSGTGFAAPAPAAADSAAGASPNADPLGRSMTPQGGSKVARSKAVKKR